MANEGVMRTINGTVPMAFIREMQKVRSQLAVVEAERNAAKREVERWRRKNIELTMLLDAATK